MRAIQHTQIMVSWVRALRRAVFLDSGKTNLAQFTTQWLVLLSGAIYILHIKEASMPNQIKVPFHGSNLFIVDHNGEPYTPMKSIVEGMGMSWQGQHEKIKSNPERWGIKVILIPSFVRNNAMTCLPLRKLFGWLQTTST
ncbi:hypothetical protein V4V55_002994 [Vibrio mimicus]